MTKNLPVKTFQEEADKILNGNILHQVNTINEGAYHAQRENVWCYKCVTSFVHDTCEDRAREINNNKNKPLTVKDYAQQRKKEYEKQDQNDLQTNRKGLSNNMRKKLQGQEMMRIGKLDVKDESLMSAKARLETEE